MAFTNALKFIDTLADSMIESAQLAGNTLIDDMRERVHKRGEATDGTLISPGYSKASYFTAYENFIVTPPDDLVSKNKKWVQLPGGYEQFRELNNLNTDVVDLEATRHLSESLIGQADPQGFIGGYIGGTGDFGDITAAAKMEILETDTYRKSIIAPSEDEKQKFELIFKQELLLRLSQNASS